MRKIYVSLPISGRNIRQQRAKALEVIDRLSVKLEDGVKFINPFDISDALDSLHKAMGIAPPTYEEYMTYDLRAQDSCTATYFCKGWEASEGCGREHRNASANNHELMYEV
jgi:hypothetical protein